MDENPAALPKEYSRFGSKGNLVRPPSFQSEYSNDYRFLIFSFFVDLFGCLWVVYKVWNTPRIQSNFRPNPTSGPLKTSKNSRWSS